MQLWVEGSDVFSSDHGITLKGDQVKDHAPVGTVVVEDEKRVIKCATHDYHTKTGTPKQVRQFFRQHLDAQH